MSLFNFKKSSQEKPSAEKIRVNGSYDIKVLGSGCKSCQTLFDNLLTTVNNMEISAKTEHVTDLTQLALYGIMTTPALVINGTVVSTGKILKPAEIQNLIVKFNGDK